MSVVLLCDVSCANALIIIFVIIVLCSIRRLLPKYIESERGVFVLCIRSMCHDVVETHIVVFVEVSQCVSIDCV